jgi:crossover junction endodeoxyribonuclease RuvC
MRVLGVDPGLNISGYCLLEKVNNQLRLLTYGTVQTPRQTSLSNRLKYLYNAATELMKKHNPKYIAIEDIFYHRNVKSAIALGQAKGTWILAGANLEIPSEEYAPRKVKSSVTGNGAATKDQVQFMLTKIFGLSEPPRPLDASDAIAVAYCSINQRFGK